MPGLLGVLTKCTDKRTHRDYSRARQPNNANQTGQLPGKSKFSRALQLFFINMLLMKAFTHPLSFSGSSFFRCTGVVKLRMTALHMQWRALSLPSWELQASRAAA